MQTSTVRQSPFMFFFLSTSLSRGFCFGCVAAFWDCNEALITGRMAVVERSLFLLDFPAPKYQRAVMFCSLEQENVLTVTFLPGFKYLLASDFYFFFHLWSTLPWVTDPLWCSEVLWDIVAFCFQNSLWTCPTSLLSHLRAVLIMNVVLLNRAPCIGDWLNGSVLPALCWSPKFQLLSECLISVGGQGNAFAIPVITGNRKMRGDSHRKPCVWTTQVVFRTPSLHTEFHYRFWKTL